MVEEERPLSCSKCLDLLSCGISCVAVTIALLSVPSPAMSVGDYQWCLRLVILLVIKYSFTIVIYFTQLVIPLEHTRNFACHAAFFITDCVVGVFLLLFTSISMAGTDDEGDKGECACNCMPSWTVWGNVAWLCAVTIRLMCIIAKAIYARPSIADAADVADAARLQHGQLPPRRVRQSDGLTDVELVSIRTFVFAPAAIAEAAESSSLVLSAVVAADNSSSTCCGVCLCEYVTGERLKSLQQCHHTYHALCIDEWLKQKNCCPSCRSPALARPAAPR